MCSKHIALKNAALAVLLAIATTAVADDGSDGSPGTPGSSDAASPMDEASRAMLDRARQTLQEILVTALRGESTWFNTPNTADVIGESDIIYRKIARTLPEALSETPGIMIQKTAHGQGSPYLRGFTSFRTLLLVDGIRLNNAVFREGPNQYWNTIDPLTVDRLEVIKGPSSVLYGSDAIGGTVNAITRSVDPFDSVSSCVPRIYYRYSTAENSQTVRGELSGILDGRLGYIVGSSIKDFGNLDGGRHVGRQARTRYHEIAGDLRLDYFFDRDRHLTFAHQHVDQDDAWRSHSTVHGFSWEGTTVGTDLKRVLDQNRDLTYLRYEAANMGGFVDAMSATLSYHVQEEFESRRRANARLTHQGFTDRTLGALVTLESPGPVGRWTYGVEYYHDWVDSYRNDYNSNGTPRVARVQGPVADDATYGTFGAFVQDDIPICDRADLIVGGRYTHVRLAADKVQGLPGGLKNHWDSFVGSARGIVRLDDQEHWAAYGGVSQGFRAPNLSDMTRFDIARTGEVETPVANLNPEKFIQYEIGLKAEYETFRGQTAFFITDIQDMIVRAPTGAFVGADREVTKRNAGDGWIHGVELEASWRFCPEWTAFGGFTYQDGEVDGYPTAAPIKQTEPVSRLMPTTGFAGLRWDSPAKKFWTEAVGTFAARAENLPASDRLDTQRIPPGGTPGYCTLTLRGGWNVNEKVTAFAALENVTNEDYRIHGSGINEPGINLVVGFDVRF